MPLTLSPYIYSNKNQNLNTVDFPSFSRQPSVMTSIPLLTIFSFMSVAFGSHHSAEIVYQLTFVCGVESKFLVVNMVLFVHYRLVWPLFSSVPRCLN